MSKQETIPLFKQGEAVTDKSTTFGELVTASGLVTGTLQSKSTRREQRWAYMNMSSNPGGGMWSGSGLEHTEKEFELHNTSKKPFNWTWIYMTCHMKQWINQWKAQWTKLSAAVKWEREKAPDHFIVADSRWDEF